MKIYKTMVAFDQADGVIYQVDTIEYQGKFWLVPEWLESLAEKYKTPSRIVQIDCLKHQRTIGSPMADFVLSLPISKAVFDGEETRTGYVVIDRPPITVQTHHGLH